MVTHFNATLGMGGWLDLAQQGLSPCKKYRAFLALFSYSFLVFSKFKIQRKNSKGENLSPN